MPPEPKRPIEKLLEASAQARRAEFGAETEMPNPMRARLHDEIARANRPGEAAPARSWLQRFWPIVSLGTALAALLLVAYTVEIGRRSEPAGNNLALQSPTVRGTEPSALLKSLDAPAQNAAIASAGAIGGRLAENDQAPEIADASEGLESDGAAGKDTRDQFASRLDGVTQSPTAPIAGVVTAAPASAAAANLSAPGENSPRQFSQANRGQTLRNNSQANKKAPILETFRFEQNGSNVRVVDADGSTYLGNFEPVSRAASSASRMLKQTQAAAAPAPERAKSERVVSDAARPNEQYFRAAGFNATLQKRVVFEGNYIPLPADKKATAAQAEVAAGEAQTPARIIGNARVAGEPPLEVDAATVER